MRGETKSRSASCLDPSTLPGRHDTRVFIGGSYVETEYSVLEYIAHVVRRAGFEPIVADQYQMPQIATHDTTLYLLHSCRLAIFEASNPSGALMELERTADYGTFCLVVYREQEGYWSQSAMLSSFVRQHERRIRLCSYVRPASTQPEIRRWLARMKKELQRAGYAQT
jgi:hypothetical protein